MSTCGTDCLLISWGRIFDSLQGGGNARSTVTSRKSMFCLSIRCAQDRKDPGSLFGSLGNFSHVPTEMNWQDILSFARCSLPLGVMFFVLCVLRWSARVVQRKSTKNRHGVYPVTTQSDRSPVFQNEASYSEQVQLLALRMNQLHGGKACN